ncbi:uncharacterized protein LOC118181785 [Stegodyphus dumicola]|uniref:uncharacterized protein LOC118181785 n=1 Tax=Stegodyphus dumicola TaxID=202533 RepID=UPI0015A8EC47|nr:uncharacterized protein LOC118181785 [Stegodyphus dumicola]
MKRTCETSDALLKNGKDRNRDMCICVTDEDEKPPVMTPEVIIVNDIHAHTCIDNRIYCPTETKPPSPYLSEHEKNEPMRRRDNVFMSSNDDVNYEAISMINVTLTFLVQMV